jgi:DNA polymerase-3 subunit delta'
MNAALKFFKGAIEKNRLAHLYLITGPKGSGRMSLVETVSHMLLSPYHKDSDHLAKMIKERQIQNMMVVEPDGAVLKRDQIEELKAEFSKTALVEGPRIYVITDAGKLNQAAANRLLKFMEEPQSGKVFGFLLSESRTDVIPTILSRAQVINIHATDESRMKDELLSKGMEERLAEIAPYLTRNIEDALLLSEDPAITDMLDALALIGNKWTDTSVSFLVDLPSKLRFLVSDRTLFMTFSEMLMLYFLDLVHYKAHQDIIFRTQKDSIIRNSDRMTTKDINDVIDAVRESLHRQAYNINLDLALDHMLHTLEKKR